MHWSIWLILVPTHIAAYLAGSSLRSYQRGFISGHRAGLEKGVKYGLSTPPAGGVYHTPEGRRLAVRKYADGRNGGGM